MPKKHDLKRKEKNAKKQLDSIELDKNELQNETVSLDQQLLALQNDLELKSRKKRPISSSDTTFEHERRLEEKRNKLKEKDEKEEKELKLSLSKEMDDLKKKQMQKKIITKKNKDKKSEIEELEAILEQEKQKANRKERDDIM